MMYELGGGCRVIGADEGERHELGTRVWRTTIGPRIDARDIVQIVSRFSTGLSRGHANPDGEETHYVAAGRGQVFIDGFEYPVEAGHAFYVPPRSVWCVRNPGPEALEIVSVACPSRDAARDDLEPQTTPAGGAGRPVRTVHERDRKPIPTGGRTFKLLADKDLGSQRVTQFLGVIPPSEAPPHYHTYEEAIFIVEGRGTMWAEGREAPVEPGSCIYLPRGVSHSLRNTADTPIRLLGVFHPSGSPAVSYPTPAAGEEAHD